MHPAPLDGLIVLDLTRLLPGAVATQYLADQGANVIKIEQPGAGDYARTLSPDVFAFTNLGKKSVAIDLKEPSSKQAFLSLAAHADVVIEGFRPGVMDRLGLGYEALSASNPRLIYVSLTGYGQSGPYAGLAGHDINYMAMGGVLGLNGGVIPGVQIADLVGGSLQAINGILLALHARHSTGQGRHVDVSMTAGVTSLLTVPFASFLQNGREPEPGNDMLTGRYACYNLYKARDGRWLAVGALESKFWTELCGRIGCPDLIDLQFDEVGQPELKARLSAIFATRAAVEWFELLRDSDCCVTPVRSVAEVAAELAVSTDERRAPRLGEHTSELIGQLEESQNTAGPSPSKPR